MPTSGTGVCRSQSGRSSRRRAVAIWEVRIREARQTTSTSPRCSSSSAGRAWSESSLSAESVGTATSRRCSRIEPAGRTPAPGGPGGIPPGTTPGRRGASRRTGRAPSGDSAGPRGGRRQRRRPRGPRRSSAPPRGAEARSRRGPRGLPSGPSPLRFPHCTRPRCAGGRPRRPGSSGERPAQGDRALEAAGASVRRRRSHPRTPQAQHARVIAAYLSWDPQATCQPSASALDRRPAVSRYGASGNGGTHVPEGRDDRADRWARRDRARSERASRTHERERRW